MKQLNRNNSFCCNKGVCKGSFFITVVVCSLVPSRSFVQQLTNWLEHHVQFTVITVTFFVMVKVFSRTQRHIIRCHMLIDLDFDVGTTVDTNRKC